MIGRFVRHKLSAMIRTIHLCAVSMAMLSSVSVEAKGPRVPAGQWAVDYAKDVCVLSRDGVASEPGIAIRTKPFSNEHDLMLYVARTGEKERSIKGHLLIDGRVAGEERWIIIGEPRRAHKQVETRITADELAELAKASSIRLWGNARSDVIAQLPKIAKAMNALRACEIELAGRWGVAPAEMAGLSRTAYSEFDLRELFWDKDPRKSVMLRNPVRALLAIDNRGAVQSCRITQSSRVSWVDIQFCEMLRAEAKFRPAVDASGKAANSKYVTPAITSALIQRKRG